MMDNYKEWKHEIHSPDVLICSCLSPDHQILFIYDTDENEVYTEIHLKNYMSFWKRIGVAIKYMFGHKCRYGNFDSVIIDKNNKHQFQKALDKIKGE